MAKLIWGIDPLAVHEKGAGAHRHSGAQNPPRAGGAGAIDGR